MDFVGVTWFGDAESYQGFIDEHGLTFPQIADDAGAVFQRFQIAGQPAMAIIDTDGSGRAYLGAVEREQLDELLTEVTA